MKFLRWLTWAMLALLWATAVGLLALTIFAKDARAQTSGCAPKELGGTGLYYSLFFTTTGFSLQWVCVDAAGKGWIQDLTWLKTYAGPSACQGPLPIALTGIPDPVALFKQALAACQTTQCVTPPTGGDCHYTDAAVDAVYQQALAATRLKWAADHPTTGPVFKVGSNGSAIYPVTNGKIGLPLSGRRAIGGTLCNCAKPIVQYGFTYCAFDGGAANEAATCIKQ